MEVATLPGSSDASADPREALEEAIKDFQNILTQEQRDKVKNIGAIRDPDTVIIFTAELDVQNQRNKGRGIASRLFSVLQCVQTFSAVVDTFVSSHPEIAALVWGSIKFTLLIAVNYTSYFENLSALLMELSSQCPRFTEYQALYTTSTRLQKALCAFHASIVRLCKRVVKDVQRPWREHIKNAFFQAFKQEFITDTNNIKELGKKVKDEIKLAKAQADRQDQLLQEKERVAASKQRSSLRRFMPKVESKLNSIKELQVQRQSIEERQRLLDSLSSHDYVTPFKEARKKHQHSTAEWIFTTSEFTRWCDGTGSALLWCSGKIGSGKAILCANVINHVLVEKSRDDHVAFFFLQYDNSDSLTAETIIRSIIRQSMDATTLSEQVEKQLMELDQKYFVQLEEWTSVLLKTLPPGAFFLFVDGLDECVAAERRALLDVLMKLTATSPSLRVFISSRDSVGVDLERMFSCMEHVVMAPINITSDIRIYIEATVQERIKDGDLVLGDPHLLNTIRDTLADHADGMFLWVKFLIREVCTASCDDEIRESLRSLPKDLEETFARALSRILSRQKKTQLVQKVFTWVAVAKRPLTLDEIRGAISIDIGQPYTTPGKVVRDMSPILLWCENLLQLTEEQPPSLQFAHSSIQEFITSGNLSTQLLGFHVDLKEADHFAGEICVTYVDLNDFRTTITRKPQPIRVNPMAMVGTALGRGTKVSELTTRFADVLGYYSAKANPDLTETLVNQDTVGSIDRFQQSHPFLKYASKYWIFHTANFQEGRSNTWTLWRDIVTNGYALAYTPWQEAIAMLIWSHRAHHYALLRYAHTLVSLPASKRVDLMEASALEGDAKAIAIYLDSGYSRNCIERGLIEASRAGHVQVVDQLINANASVDAVSATGETPLHEASERGHYQVVKRLLCAGANVHGSAMLDHLTGQQTKTPLHIASQAGHTQVVKQLINAGAGITVVDESTGMTPLQEALNGGHLQVVEELLSAGADISARSRQN